MNPSPFIDNSPELRPYWEAAAQGRFLLPWCRACGRTHWYPRGACPHCLSTDIEHRPASGRGQVHSWTVNASIQPPGVLAFVTLEEGPTLLTRLVDAAPDAVAIGQPVTFAGPQTGPGRAPVPLFKPA